MDAVNKVHLGNLHLNVLSSVSKHSVNCGGVAHYY